MNFPQTLYGWSFIFSLFFTIWLVRQTLVKWRREEIAKSGKDEGMGCISAGILTLILGTMTFLFFPFLIMFVETNNHYITLPKYESNIVEIESRWEKQEYTDSNKRTQTRDVLMHTSIVEFTDNAGNKQRMPSSIRSGDKPIVGNKLRVVHKPGMQTALELSFRALAMQFGLGIMLLILGFILLMITRWALGKNNENLMTLGINAMLKLGIPIAMLAMTAGMIYGLVRHFTGENDLPIWTVGLLIFFVIGLGLGLIGYLRAILQKNPEDRHVH